MMLLSWTMRTSSYMTFSADNPPYSLNNRAHTLKVPMYNTSGSFDCTAVAAYMALQLLQAWW
jgi:hypothetical protein